MEPQSQSTAFPTHYAPESGWRGFGRGLFPLLILAGGIVAALALTLAARELTAGISFAIGQWIVMGVFVAALGVAAVVYGVALVRTFRRWRAQLRDEGSASGTGMLWALIVTAGVVALPVIVAALVPQHPAP